MAFVKIVKNNAYYKRYQTKFRRRREGKTDFYARRRLVAQDKNKYETRKYRLVVRRTNRKIITQVIYSTIQGDRVMTQANSAELPRYGVEVGLTNYAASYCTGLLCARRLLTQLKLADSYKGSTEVSGEVFDVYDRGEVAEKRPFKAALDLGIARATTGNRAFGALKGATDGGLYVPHKNKRSPGFSTEKATERGEKATSHFDAEVHRQHIFGIHVDKYMEKLEAENAEGYKKQFSKWDAFLKKAGTDSLEEIYKKVHAGIRKDSSFKKKPAPKAPVRKSDGQGHYTNSKGGKWWRPTRISREQRRKNAAVKIQKAMQQ